ncbi:MAG: DUF1622 domain-containing protein [Leptolyngbya sp.]|nr:DUF1622 domain-containing protein [Leptolyngbya sp.]
MNGLHTIETFSVNLAILGETILEALGVICIFLGLLATAQLVFKILKDRRRVLLPFIQVRLKFGLWLALALEFQLGADILNTAIAPNQDALIRLAVIAIIRTFLNYFLNKEIESQLEFREQAATHPYHPLYLLDSPLELMKAPQDTPQPPTPQP